MSSAGGPRTERCGGLSGSLPRGGVVGRDRRANGVGSWLQSSRGGCAARRDESESHRNGGLCPSHQQPEMDCRARQRVAQTRSHWTAEGLGCQRLFDRRAGQVPPKGTSRQTPASAPDRGRERNQCHAGALTVRSCVGSSGGFDGCPRGARAEVGRVGEDRFPSTDEVIEMQARRMQPLNGSGTGMWRSTSSGPRPAPARPCSRPHRLAP